MVFANLPPPLIPLKKTWLEKVFLTHLNQVDWENILLLKYPIVGSFMALIGLRRLPSSRAMAQNSFGIYGKIKSEGENYLKRDTERKNKIQFLYELHIVLVWVWLTKQILHTVFILKSTISQLYLIQIL